MYSFFPIIALEVHLIFPARWFGVGGGGPTGAPSSPLFHPHRALLCGLDRPLCSFSQDALPGGFAPSRTQNRSLPHPSGRKQKCRTLHPELGYECSYLSLQESPESVHGWIHQCHSWRTKRHLTRINPRPGQRLPPHPRGLYVESIVGPRTPKRYFLRSPGKCPNSGSSSKVRTHRELRGYRGPINVRSGDNDRKCCRQRLSSCWNQWTLPRLRARPGSEIAQ